MPIPSPPGRGEGLYFLTFPPLDTLCSVTVSVPALQIATGSPYQPHVIRCRELIFTEPEILASPVYGMDRHIQIIMQQSFYKSGKLQSRFQKIGIEMQKPRRVLPRELQACMSYTLTAKLAPMWNKAGDLLVEGRDFINSTDKLNAVNFQLTLSENQAYMALRAYTVKMPPLKLPDLGVSPPVLTEFSRQHPDGKIQEYSIYSKWCHILPSLKKGQVISVTQTLPPDSPFRSYKDMKRYWKNTYGYRLPELESDVLYCQVYFKLIGNQLFTYPDCCIRPRNAHHLPRPDTGTITDSFLQVLNAKVPSVCGVKFNVVPQVKYVQPQLGPCVTQDNSSTQNEPNLTDVQTEPSSKVASRPSASIQALEINATVVEGRVVDVPSSMRIDAEPKGKSNKDSATKSAWIPQSGNGFSQTMPEIRPSEVRPQENVQDRDKQGNEQQKKIIPVFKPKKFGMASGITTSKPMISKDQPSRIVTVFHKSIQKLMSTAPKPTAKEKDLPKTGILSSDIVERTPSSMSVNSKPKPPVFSKSLVNTAMHLPKPIPLSTPTNRLSLPSIKRTPSSIQQVTLNSKAHTHQDPYYARTRSPGSTCSSGYEFQTGTANPNSRVHPSLVTSMRFGNGPVNRQESPIVRRVTATSGDTPGKRSMQMPGNETPNKKPRSRPKVQEDVDVENLLRSNQVGKLNAATLLNWLKQKGVACRSKDKKSELIEKGLTFLSLTANEH